MAPLMRQRNLKMKKTETQTARISRKIITTHNNIKTKEFYLKRDSAEKDETNRSVSNTKKGQQGACHADRHQAV